MGDAGRLRVTPPDGTPAFAGQLFDIDVLELNQAGRAGPVAVLVLAAVVLEGDAAVSRGGREWWRRR